MLSQYKYQQAIYWTTLIVVSLIGVGVVPRPGAFVVLGMLALYMLFASTKENLVLFVSLIPFLIALPFTQVFDSFNTWRILSAIIFLKWFFSFPNPLRTAFQSIKQALSGSLKHGLATWIAILFFIVVISAALGADVSTSARRIIYFINLSLIGIPIYHIVRTEKDFLRQLFFGIRRTAFVVTGIGFIQLGLTYILPPDVFFTFFAQTVQKNFYGQYWADIALQGNTWFSYFQSAFTLRMFSTFTSSHVFPLYLILSLPAIIAVSKRTTALLYGVQILMIAIVLSSTRGIWATGIIPIGLALVMYIYHKKQNLRTEIKHALMYLILFIFAFAPAYLIFNSGQFNLPLSDALRNRLGSILDLGELSNQGRIAIWHETLESIAQRPVLGVGIGNFPVVLYQSVWLARAGSSAHNIYLHVAAEMGLVALVVFFVIVMKLIGAGHQVFRWSSDPLVRQYSLLLMLAFVWMFTYLSTDATLFDERLFLIFLTNAAVLWGLRSQLSGV